MNISEILKNMPKGRMLYSPMYGSVEFDFVNEVNNIVCYYNIDNLTKKSIVFSPEGKYYENGECMLFPAPMTSWEDWPKHLIRRGDVLYQTAVNLKSVYIVENTDAERSNVLFYCHTSYGKVFYEYDDLASYNLVAKDFRFGSTPEIQEIQKAANEKGYFLDFDDVVSKTSFMKKIKDFPNKIEGEKFEVTSLKPFDQVLWRKGPADCWNCGIFNRIVLPDKICYIIGGIDGLMNIPNSCIIPYNDETKYLLGETFMPPLKYRIR